MFITFKTILACLSSGEIIQQKLEHYLKQSQLQMNNDQTSNKAISKGSKTTPPKNTTMGQIFDFSCIDWRLVSHVTLAGMLGNGCVCCLWYNHIFDRLIKPGFTAKILAKRVMVDNCIAGGSCLIVFYASELKSKLFLA